MTSWRPVLSGLLVSTALAACAGGGGGAGSTAGSSGGTSSGGTGVAGSAGGAAGASAGSGGAAAAGAGGAGTGGAAAGNGGATGGTGPGTGGSGGTAPTGPCDFAGKIMCDDFEADPLGMKPTGGPWATSQCFATGFTLQVDGTQHKSGARSLVSQGVPYGDCMLHADLGTVSDFWVRAQVRWAAGAANQFTAHEVSAFELTPTMSTDDPGIRVGFRGDNSCQPTGVEVNITGGQEQTGCTGFQPQADTWTCFELHVVRDTGDNSTTADLFIDGADQSYHVHGTPSDTVVNPNPAVWRYLRLGTRSYSNAYPSNVYVDDIAVGTQRIGCN
ncbi:MAG TPA: hypothetical protein VIF57_32715 [Polyangia bacterium]|jgi:hypothetical protein